MVYDNDCHYSCVQEEEPKRNQEARTNSFKASQRAMAMGDHSSAGSKSKKTKLDQEGAWGSMYKNREHFVNMHIC